jgi:hypothetical protein
VIITPVGDGYYLHLRTPKTNILSIRIIGAGIVTALTAQLTTRNKEDHNASGCDDGTKIERVRTENMNGYRIGDALYA